MKSFVIRDIVENDLCIGCGLCAAICPQHILSIEWNRFGEYNPVEKSPCDTECGLCLKVCPFADGNDNEDSIGKALYGEISGICHSGETGYFLNSYVGYAPITRKRGASGGMATWLLSTLLQKGIVDYVIAVVPNDDPDNLFKFAILSNPEAVLDSSGSVYYPVEFSDVLRQIQNNPGKYAIIGIPCFIKGIRLAQKRNKNLKDRIAICIGLICGQMKTKDFTSYIANLACVRGPLKKVQYRGKNPGYPASNFFFSFDNDTGDTGNIFWNNGISEAWVNRWFTPIPCNYCDDIFAECADVAFMDAWLPQYSKDNQGTSIVLVRSQQIQDAIKYGIKNHELSLDPIAIEKVVESQVGVIDIKRHHLAYQLYLGHQKGMHAPVKRVVPSELASAPSRQKIILKNQMQRVSREFWDPEKQDAEHLRANMQPYLAQLAKMNESSRIFIFPLKIIRYIRRKIRSFFHE
jgi:coenzyme F420 hydrogenase subunit beta